jgi:hypothetical protein
MSKGLDLITKEQGGTSHQATLVIGGINFINTGTGYGQYSHSKEGNKCTTHGAALVREGSVASPGPEGQHTMRPVGEQEQRERKRKEKRTPYIRSET